MLGSSGSAVPSGPRNYSLNRLRLVRESAVMARMKVFQSMLRPPYLKVMRGARAASWTT